MDLITTYQNFTQNRVDFIKIVKSLGNIAIFLFLLANNFAHFFVLFRYGIFVKAVILTLPCLLFLFIKYRIYLNKFFFLFGFSFFLFGFRPYDVESILFGYIVSCIALLLFVLSLKKPTKVKLNKHLSILLFSYVCLSLFSFSLFPLGYILKNIYFFGPKAFILEVFYATANSYYYSFASINRLILFCIFIYLLSTKENYKQLYKSLFIGALSGAIFCSFIGILDYYNFISLQWYRHNTLLSGDVLHSTFLNRGWFSEFIVTVIPFVIIGFAASAKLKYLKIFLFFVLILCEVALLLSGARAGWVSYPLVLLICWIFYYFDKKINIEKSSIKVKHFIKVILSVPITIIISFIVVYYAIIPSANFFKNKINNNTVSNNHSVDNIKTSNFIKERGSIIFDSTGRLVVWKHGLAVVFEKPFFGMGYETFSWHGNILKNISKSNFNKLSNKKVQETSHNIFLQLFVSGGVIGLLIWISLTIYSILILTVDCIKNKNFINSSVIVSIISFHLVGIFQSMQYIPMIWFLIFLNFGYALTVNEEILSKNHRKFWNIISSVIIAIAVLSIFVYSSTSFSNTLKKKYNLKAYELDQDQYNYLGFYNKEKWRRHGYYRWIGKRASVKLLAKTNDFCFNVVAHPHNIIPPDGLIVDILFNGKPLDTVKFNNAGQKKLCYDKPSIKGKNIELEFKVNKTFNPMRIGLNGDYRYLGVAVSEVSFK